MNIQDYKINIANTTQEERLDLIKVLENHNQYIFAKSDLLKRTYPFTTCAYDSDDDDWYCSSNATANISYAAFMAKYDKPKITFTV